MAKERDIISLALTESMVEVEGVRSEINPPQSFTLRTLLKNQPSYLSTAEIADAGNDYGRREITVAMRGVARKVNARHEVIGTSRQNGTGRKLFSVLEHVVETAMGQGDVTPREFKVSQPYWYWDAVCGPEDAALFSADGAGNSLRKAAVSARFCSVCPVIDSCVAEAVIIRDEHTLRGGMTPEERLPLIKAHELFVNLNQRKS